jgi:hypothetical protein
MAKQFLQRVLSIHQPVVSSHQAIVFGLRLIEADGGGDFRRADVRLLWGQFFQALCFAAQIAARNFQLVFEALQVASHRAKFKGLGRRRVTSRA